jgi:hypothetical protein
MAQLVGVVVNMAKQCHVRTSAVNVKQPRCGMFLKIQWGTQNIAQYNQYRSDDQRAFGDKRVGLQI